MKIIELNQETKELLKVHSNNITEVMKILDIEILAIIASMQEIGGSRDEMIDLDTRKNELIDQYFLLDSRTETE